MKKVWMICVAVWLFCQATVFAHNMPTEEFCIGGITPGCTLEYVTGIYGEPNERKWKEDWRYAKIPHYYVTYDYSPTLSVTGLPKGKSLEEELEATAEYITLKDNSLSTPSGITVGISYQTVVSKFGEGRKHSYQGNTWYTYGMGRSAYEMQLYVDGKGKITKIHIYNSAIG